MAQKAHSLSHTKRYCSITLCSPLSINEMLSKINIKVVYHIRITKNFKKWQYLLTRILSFVIM